MKRLPAGRCPQSEAEAVFINISIHGKGNLLPAQQQAIQVLHGIVCFLGNRHLDYRLTPRTIGPLVAVYLYFLDLAIWSKGPLKVRLNQVYIEVRYLNKHVLHFVQ